jgi:hypothetical protein
VCISLTTRGVYLLNTCKLSLRGIAPCASEIADISWRTVGLHAREKLQPDHRNVARHGEKLILVKQLHSFSSLITTWGRDTTDHSYAPR